MSLIVDPYRITGNTEVTPGQKSSWEKLRVADRRSRNLPEALDKGEGFVKDKVVLSGVGDTASRQSLVEDQDLQASR